MKVTVYVTPRGVVRHPESEAILKAVRTHLKLTEILGLKKGVFFVLDISEKNQARAEEIARQAAENLLRNPVMEDYYLKVEGVS